ncbi:MAG TPA: hypothetical protein VE222_10765 [Nitrospiraceae bacterium]|nr:hypothetical protein [Nitrospiraceae bacterium]
MAINLIVIVVVLLIIGYLALPSYYLTNAVDREAQDGVKEHLGQPLQSIGDATGRSIWIYKQVVPPLCVEYTLTFKRGNLSDETMQPDLSDKATLPVLRKWIWKWC